MIMTGLHCLYMLGSLGTVEQQEYWDEAQQVYLYTQGDQSITILLYGVANHFCDVADGLHMERFPEERV